MSDYEIHDGFKVRIIARLKNAKLIGAREVLGLSAKATAEQIGMSIPFYCNIENLHKYPGPETQKRICDFFRERDIFLLEEDVFPEELKNIKPKTKYELDRIVSKTSLSLSGIGQKMLPCVESEVGKSMELEDNKKKLEELLSKLSHTEQTVIKMRYGLYGETTHTHKQIGDVINVTSEQVSNIEERALDRIYGYIRREKLKDILVSE